MSSSTSTTEAIRSDTRFFGHPLPLMQLFSLELWERFSYYGMNGILALYLYFSVTDGGMGMEQGTAVGIVGAYGGAVFLATILGAWIADRLAGAEKVLFYSAIIIMIGHICLALIPGFGEWQPASSSSHSAPAVSRRTPRPWSANSTKRRTRAVTPASPSSTWV
jgi:POT family proton-dependent oligopeptide transporter